MPRRVESPVRRPSYDGVGGEYEEHPAYGQIVVSRVSGSTALYGTDFLHQHYILLRIQESTLRRSLSRDWPHAGNHIIEVAMSESQWASFVSSMNVGNGVQCTITRREGHDEIPALPPPRRAEQFTTESNEQLSKVSSELKALRHKVDILTLGLSRVKAKELFAHIDAAERAVSDALPFVAQQMEKHMETVIESAKVEIHGYVNQQIARAGLTALGSAQNDPLTLESPEASETHE